MKWSVDVHYIQLIDGVVEFISVLTDFLPAGFSAFSDRGVLKSPTMIMDSFISPCSSISFCLTYFDALLLGNTH